MSCNCPNTTIIIKTKIIFERTIELIDTQSDEIALKPFLWQNVIDVEVRSQGGHMADFLEIYQLQNTNPRK
jgi:hypothetical protein